MAEVAIALDLSGASAALRLVDELGDLAAWYKVGPVPFVTGGPALVRELRERGKRVFLDLKWHDIPSTVAGAVEAAGALGVGLATVHLSGGRRMLEAAFAKRAGDIRLVGVGVLTAFDGESFREAVGRAEVSILDEQLRLVRAGLDAGLDAFVTSPAELAEVRRAAGDGAFLVVPGIRPRGGDSGDQARTATPREAVLRGADLLVVGRPVTAARSPRDALKSILEDMEM
jgi:orotidine-5'-phosphate decarboxylase